MLRDVERGGPTEAEHVIGDMVQSARIARVDVPLLAIAYAHLQAYEQRRQRANAR
jgi:2-dehydropantoate 2-reductase